MPTTGLSTTHTIYTTLYSSHCATSTLVSGAILFIPNDLPSLRLSSQSKLFVKNTNSGILNTLIKTLFANTPKLPKSWKIDYPFKKNLSIN